MVNSPDDRTSVGIIANPASGQDIRRLISAASGCSIAEKTNIVRRLCLGLSLFGIDRVSMIPDRSGIAGSLLRSKEQGSVALNEGWPDIELLDMVVEDKAVDTLRAVRLMVESGVRLIIVLGGDGTHRLVASACGDVPLVALSTGTNNCFPQFREATIVGLAAGLVASGAVSVAQVTRRNKALRVEVNSHYSDIALVDLCLTDDLWIGSRALWKPEKIKEIFVAFAEVDAIGWSAVAGQSHPISRDDDHGLHMTLCQPGKGQSTIYTPIAPGLVLPIGVASIEILKAGEKHPVAMARGVVALDGEREFMFSPEQKITIWLDRDGPLTVDTYKVLQIAAERGLMSDSSLYLAAAKQ